MPLSEHIEKTLVDTVMPQHIWQDAIKELNTSLQFAQDRSFLELIAIWAGTTNVDPRVLQAFSKINRSDFVPADFAHLAYTDRSLQKEGTPVMTRPSLMCYMIHLLRPQEDSVVLEIGSGSGYNAAILSQLARKVYTIENNPAFAELARTNLQKHHITNVEVVIGDGADGYKRCGPYDRILYTAAPSHISEQILTQLAKGGRAVGLVGNRTINADSIHGNLHTIIRAADGTFREKIDRFPAYFVPLESPHPGGWTRVGGKYYIASQTTPVKIYNRLTHPRN